jgi:hypothetical protein
MSAFLEQHPDVGVVYGDVTMIGDYGHTIADAPAPSPGELAIRNIVGASFMYRCEVQHKLSGYNQELLLVEDFEFWLRGSEYFRIAPLHRNLYLAWRHANSLGATRRRTVLESTVRLMSERLPRMQWAGKRNMAGGYVKLADHCFELRRRRQACQFLFKALREAPLHTLWRYKFSMSRWLLGARIANEIARLMGARKPVIEEEKS